MGSAERKRNQAEALAELRIAGEIRSDLQYSDLLGSKHPADRRDAGHIKIRPSEASQPFYSQAPEFANNPVYVNFAEAAELYDGLHVTGWTAEPGETRYVDKRLRVRVSNRINTANYNYEPSYDPLTGVYTAKADYLPDDDLDWDRHRSQIAKDTLRPDSSLWTKPSLVNGNTYGGYHYFEEGNDLTNAQAIADAIVEKLDGKMEDLKTEMRDTFREQAKAFYESFESHAEWKVAALRLVEEAELITQEAA